MFTCIIQYISSTRQHDTLDITFLLEGGENSNLKNPNLFMHIHQHTPLVIQQPVGAPKIQQKLDRTKHTGSVKNMEEKKI